MMNGFDLIHNGYLNSFGLMRRNTDRIRHKRPEIAETIVVQIEGGDV